MGKDALQKRMEMPIGVKPAARVKRRGKPIEVPMEVEDTPIENMSVRHKQGSSAGSSKYASTTNDSTTTDGTQDPMSEILGSVVERPRKPKGSPKKTIIGNRHSSNNGFPSLRTAPVGTLVRPRPPANTTKRPTPVRKEVIISDGKDDESNRPVNPKNNDDVASIIKESQREAAAMLQSMSRTEIQQQAQELQTALSPDLISFLQQRGGGRTTKDSTPPNKTKSTVSFVDEPTTRRSSLDETLATIRTYEDLDAAYDTYVKEHKTTIFNKSNVAEINDEFKLACDLLRSTSPHQTLWAARRVALELPSRQHDIPKLLPISLRCLLDSNISAGGSALQATYVLKSLYILVCKFACREHVVDVTGKTADAAAIYQLHVLDDAVPKPRIRSCYEAINAQSIATNEMGAAYTTQSSALSAQSDAEAFRKDPAWTLLSRTRILPRLATIARLSTTLPEEAWVSMCGILAMLGQRSPGAATAILEHSSLLSCLEKRLLFERGQYKPNRSLPMILLYCTLSRQSRYAAKRISERTTEKLVEILSLGESDNDWRLLHRWTLVLWRTLLRYGYATSIAQPLLTIATPILTLGVNDKDNLEVATGFYSCFAQLLKHASTCCLYSESKSAEEATTSSNTDVLKQISLWLTSESSWRQAVNHLQWPCGDEKVSPSFCSFYASVLIFVKASLHHVMETIGREAVSHTKAEIASRVKELSEIIRGFILEPSIASVIRSAVECALCPRSFKEDIEYAERLEAASCCLLTSISNDINFISRRSALATSSPACVESVSSLVASWEKLLGNKVIIQQCGSVRATQLELSRLRWINLSLTTILLSGTMKTTFPWKIGTFALIGRLQCGEEALFAAVLNRGLLNDGGSSHLATALATLLCGSSFGKSQLQHSRTILEQFIEESEAVGSASLDIKTLLAESVNATVEDFLPMGEHWLWQLAAGSFRSGKANESAAEEENNEVMSEALGTIFRCEQSSVTLFANNLGLGPKVYWIVCIFLRGNADNFGTASTIIKRYTNSWTADDCSTFISVCQEQYLQLGVARPAEVEDSVEPDPAARKIIESNIPEASVRALEALINDVCDKFMRDGPDSPFGVMCVRIFLTTGFTSKIRCLVFQKLRETIHLLTHDDLRDNDAAWLSLCVEPGLEPASKRDPPELIDFVVDLYSLGCSVRRDDCFVKNLGILLLARNLILTVKTTNDSSLRVMYSRLKRVDQAVSSRVVGAVSRYLQKDDDQLETLVGVIIENVADEIDQGDVSLELASVIERYRTVCFPCS